ncbi:uncharacterized protein LOC141632429 [Silene latifolia]|uniref:uncharacterized protein LOC141632429 n=1 Tax=Silene latifolia TaxID=37657 RepID=UPI003D77D111
MEVLSKYLREICLQPSVSYHPKCSRIGVTHLIFSDDLMIFTRGDVPSVQAVLNTLNKFTSWTGLIANTEKTEIYFGGVQATIKEQILTLTGFPEGHFPFRYLGLPLNTAKNTVVMYCALITKIQAAIQHWSTKLLYYAGKVQLLNSIFFGLENFLCAGGLLPRTSPTGIWSKWNHAYNLTQGTIWDSDSREYFSESFKGILTVKNEILQATCSLSTTPNLLTGWCISGKYNTHLAYH